MVSEDLRTLAAHMRRLLGEEHTSPEVFEAAIARLEVHTEQVVELEAAIEPNTELPGHIVALAWKLHREGVRVGAADIEGGES